MVTINQTIQNELLSQVRVLNGKVEHYRGSTLLNTFAKNTSLQKIEIQRVAENSRFFGMVICQRLNIKVRDKDRVINVQSGDKLIPYIGKESDFVKFPTFTITEVNRDEKTNQLSITGYDIIDKLKEHTTSEILPTPPYTTDQFITLLCAAIDTTHRIVNVDDLWPFNLTYGKGANFDGTETLFEALQFAAEATLCVVFVDNQDQLVFKRLSPNEQAAFSITKSLYTDLVSKTNRRLVGVGSQTELGDNVVAKLEQSGTTQFVKDNPFWDMRDDIGDILDDALDELGGLTINQFTCSWVGNPFLEIGDKINLTTKDNQTVSSYVLDDIITYDGSLKEKTQWDYLDDEENDYASSSSLGDMLKQTYARVNKQDRKIDLVASDITDARERIASLGLTTDSITASVSDVSTTVDNLSQEVQGIKNQVQSTMTDTQIHIAIMEAIENNVGKVETETGFTFDKDGLKIQKDGSDLTTLIDEDGMDISRGSTKVLTVDSTGVNALNLKARTYLIIGTNSRFEDYGYNRTGCFYIGN